MNKRMIIHLRFLWGSLAFTLAHSVLTTFIWNKITSPILQLERTWTHQKPSDWTEGPEPIHSRAKIPSFLPPTIQPVPCPGTPPTPCRNSLLLFMPVYSTWTTLPLLCSNLPRLSRLSPSRSSSMRLSLATWDPEVPLFLKYGLWVAWHNSLWVQACNSTKMGPPSYTATVPLVEPCTELSAKEILNKIALHLIELIWIEQ